MLLTGIVGISQYLSFFRFLSLNADSAIRWARLRSSLQSTNCHSMVMRIWDVSIPQYGILICVTYLCFKRLYFSIYFKETVLLAVLGFGGQLNKMCSWRRQITFFIMHCLKLGLQNVFFVCGCSLSL